MGCSASRFDTLVAKAIEGSSSPFSYSSYSGVSSESSSTKLAAGGRPTRCLTAPLVHHPALRKGDTQHLVCLTSSTYGSLVVADENPSPTAGVLSDDSSPDSVINTWELMEGLEAGDEGFDSDLGKDLKFNAFDFNGAQKNPSLKLGFNLSNSCESLNLNLNGANLIPSSKLGLDLADSVKKLSDSYVFVEMPGEIIEEEGFDSTPNSKPLWKHLSEESLLSKMDPNVASSYQKALSAKKLGSDESRRMTKSMGSNQFAELNKSVSVSYVPMIAKSSSFASRVNNRGVDEKIVLYFTSLRGIRKTYEDCSLVRMILRGFRVMVEEKDISMDLNYRKELQSALCGKAMSLPQLFIGGKHIGGANEVKELHESGELERLLEGYPIQDGGFVCERCGESRFIPCSSCNGSRKVFVEDEGQMRRCMDCNENGLVRCPSCCS